MCTLRAAMAVATSEDGHEAVLVYEALQGDVATGDVFQISGSQSKWKITGSPRTMSKDYSEENPRQSVLIEQVGQQSSLPKAGDRMERVEAQ